MYDIFHWEKRGDDESAHDNISSTEAFGEPVNDIIVQSDDETGQAKNDHTFQ